MNVQITPYRSQMRLCLFGFKEENTTACIFFSEIFSIKLKDARDILVLPFIYLSSLQFPSFCDFFF